MESYVVIQALHTLHKLLQTKEWLMLKVPLSRVMRFFYKSLIKNSGISDG